MREIKIDLTRCKHCNKRPRGKQNLATFEKYYPFCSYHCQETYNMRQMINYCAQLRQQEKTT